MCRGSPFAGAPSRSSAGALVLGILVAVNPIGSVAAFACDPTFEFACQVGQTIGKDAHDAGQAVARTAHEAGTAIAKTAHEFGTAVGKTARKVGTTVGQGAHEVGHAFNRGIHGQAADASQSAPARPPGSASPASP